MITEAHQEVAQALLEELAEEMKKKTAEAAGLEGAIQGVRLLFARLVETNAATVVEEASDKDTATENTGSKTKAKK